MNQVLMAAAEPNIWVSVAALVVVAVAFIYCIYEKTKNSVR